MRDEALAPLFAAPFTYDAVTHPTALLARLKEEIARAAAALPEYGRVVAAWPVPLAAAEHLTELPFLHVSAFRREPPLALVARAQIKRVVRSSATSGQAPSQVALDSVTARRMTRGVVAIFRDFVGSARRPYLVIDHPGTTASAEALSARAAAILGLQSFASEVSHGLRLDADGRSVLAGDALASFGQANRDRDVLLYGFTTVLWQDFVLLAEQQGLTLALPHARVFHSGGWKRLTELAVTPGEFNRRLAAVLGCPAENITDFYGMAENVGVVYPDCAAGCKHSPSFGAVLVRDPLDLRPVGPGGTGIIQLLSLLPESFPGHSLLTDDLATVVYEDGCPCGRAGVAFRFAGRVPKAEMRGCGNLQPLRHPGRRHG